MNDIAISVRNVSKCYRVFDDQRSRLLHAILPGHTSGVQEVWALRDINFEIKRGESVAIIGRNGGGKSTLLEILTGTLTPTTGEVNVNGRVSALLELGSGFNPEYSGRDNVILNGLLLGLSKKEILARFSEIEAFAEIGVAIERPVKTYSSGMIMRLAFAVQVLCDPDILIIDEALSVGDFFFQQKCLRHIKKISDAGVTILFVSHDMQTVRELCSKGLFLKSGSIKFWGDNLSAVNHYLSDASGPPLVPSAIPFTHPESAAEHSSQKFIDAPLWSYKGLGEENHITAVGVSNIVGAPVTSVRIGDEIVLRVLYKNNTDIACQVTCIVKNKFDQIVTTFGTYTQNVEIPEADSDSAVRDLRFKVRMMVEAGEYSLQVNLGTLSSRSAGTSIFETPWLGPISVMWNYEEDVPPFYGLVGLPINAEFC